MIIFKTTFAELLHKEVHVESVDLKGIISRIYHRDPSNFKSNVVATASYSNQNYPYNALDPKTAENERWVSNTNSGREKFIVEIKGMKFRIKSYKIVSENSASGESHLKSRNFSCSADGKKWDILQYKKDCSDLNGPSILKEYRVISNNLYSFFKIEATGYSWNPYSPHNVKITIQQIDIFEKRFTENKPYYNGIINSALLLIIILLS